MDNFNHEVSHMGVRIADLPKDVQDRVRAGLPEEKRRPGGRDVRNTGGPQHTTCQTCKAEFPTFPKAERHARANRGHGHLRITLS